jgi:hypothetical protein
MSRPTICRPVCPGIKHPSGAYDQILSSVRQLRVCWCGAFSLTRGRVCHLQMLLALASEGIFGSESLGTNCLRFETSLFVASYDSQVHGGDDPNINHHLEQLVLFCFSRYHGKVLTEPVPSKLIIPCLFFASGTCLLNRWLSMDFYSGSTIPAFRRHVTVLNSRVGELFHFM